LKTERRDEAVRLSWMGNTENDLAGYNVYRVAGGEIRRINYSLIQTPQFVDEKPGQESYISYYITAVDKAGNESDRSQEQTIILKE
jgi:penicillin-binding protein 1B